MRKLLKIIKNRKNMQEKYFLVLSVCGYIVAFVLFLCACYKAVFVFLGVGALFSLIIKTEVPENACFPKEPLRDDEIEALWKVIDNMK